MQPAMEDKLDISEKGAVKGGGERQKSDTRLFMQFLAFTGCEDEKALIAQLEKSGIQGVLYEDANDPRGVGLLVMNEVPELIVSRVRSLLDGGPFAALQAKPEYTWLGRTYAIGHEPDLEDWLLRKPRRSALDPEWPWAIWYPLRRAGAFAAMPPDEQSAMLREHGKIGHAFGEAALAKDVRLACFGLDKNDNDFIIGLIGRDLYPLSACVQAMRKTRQTSQFIEKMGPFFVGRALWQAKP
ncbi:MAG: chlorite dismutase family protein [Elusimicrobia bacterium]|nr:chlorite dismutase family protein [Elusimicrobiota bacterium]